MLTLREAVRRRLLWALVLFTIVLVALTAWGFGQIQSASPLPEIQTAIGVSQLLILLAFMFSFVLAMTAVSLGSPAIAGLVESGEALALLARPLRRSDLVLGRWIGFAVIIVVYATVAGMLEVGAAALVTGYTPPRPLEASLYIAAEGLVLLTLAVLLSTRLGVITGGAVSVVLFGIAWIMGVMGQVGVAFSSRRTQDRGRREPRRAADGRPVAGSDREPPAAHHDARTRWISRAHLRGEPLLRVRATGRGGAGTPGRVGGRRAGRRGRALRPARAVAPCPIQTGQVGLVAAPGNRRLFQMPRKAITMLDTDPRTDTPAVRQPDDLAFVRLTEAAATKLRQLTAEEPSSEIGLRVYVYGGGCSGFRYGMMLDDQPTPDDARIDAQGLRVYVDAESRQYLAGSEIDYVDTLMGAGFTVNNPNAVSACGCGSSFRTADSRGCRGLLLALTRPGAPREGRARQPGGPPSHAVVWPHVPCCHGLPAVS